MNIRRLTLTVLVPAAVVLPLGACSGNDSAASSTTASTTTTATPPKNFQVSTPQGQVSLSLDGQLPPGWPTDFPLPEDTEPAGSGSLGDAAETVRVGVFTTAASGQETLDFYSNNSDLTTDNPSVAGSGDRLVGSLDLTSPYTGGVTVLSREGSTYVVVTLNDSRAETGSTTTTSG